MPKKGPQRRADTYLVIGAPHTSGYQVLNSQFAPHVRRIPALAFVAAREGGLITNRSGDLASATVRSSVSTGLGGSNPVRSSSTASLQNTCLATAADNIEALRDRAFEHFLLSLSAIVGSLIGD
jgi:hypothetical protein